MRVCMGSEGFYPGGTSRFFFKSFSKGVKKVMKFGFYH